jgi:lipoprotein NlpD
MKALISISMVLLSLMLLSCEERTDLAPVTELRWHHPHASAASTHRVLPGETLYAIAFRYDTDYEQLASLNHIPPPYLVKVGQRLLLRPYQSQNVQAYPVARRPMFTSKPVVSTRWRWPVTGKIASHFAPLQGKKGIDIACSKGSKIRATASGVVAYAGSGLLGYGNLIIIKHNNEYLTAYGNNARNLVKEGSKVSAGQIIAEAGLIDRHYFGVHFEIRKKGIPVNPLNYLM